jgi:hypothetical protein
MPFLSKRRYLISYSDLSKSMVESGPLRDVGATSVRSVSNFVFLDFLHLALFNTLFHRRGFLDEAARERNCQVDFQPPRRALTIEARELEASAISTT